MLSCVYMKVIMCKQYKLCTTGGLDLLGKKERKEGWLYRRFRITFKV